MYQPCCLNGVVVQQAGPSKAAAGVNNAKAAPKRATPQKRPVAGITSIKAKQSKAPAARKARGKNILDDSSSDDDDDDFEVSYL